jgi:hypothetical protein
MAGPTCQWLGRKRKEGCGAGPAEGEDGPVWAACARRKEGRRPERVCGLKEKGKGMGVGPAGRKWREERERGFSFFNSFQIRFSNFQTSIKQETMHSNHDPQSLIISNLFK